MIRKPTFLERLTGGVKIKDFGDDDDHPIDVNEDSADSGQAWNAAAEEANQEGELPVDMYHTSEHVVIRALVAGVDPDDLEISITRDMVTIRGSREEDREAPDEDYYHRELYWGAFSRTILLPEEVLIDQAEAKERHGLLSITLPKVDKNRSAKLKVKPH